MQTSEDVYVRTALRVCENLQRLAATHAKAQLHRGPDFFGEEHLLRELALFLKKAGVDADEVAAQVTRLTVADYSLLPEPLAGVSSWGTISSNAEALQESAGDGVVTPLALPAAAPFTAAIV